jgi:pimeloyl-ACP methyl ester carboxylesterase
VSDASPVNEPTLPHGRRVELPGRGTTFIREVAGPPGAPTLVLLHGLVASGGLNWFQVFGPLSRRFNVVAPDLRGHGRGVRSNRRFTLADCADDVAALLDELDCGPAIVVGYSMGGPVAQLLWKRHPDRVAGLVLCATGTRFVPGVRERLIFVTAVAAAASGTRAGQALTRVPLDFVRRRIPAVIRRRPQSFRVWAAAEMRRHDWRMVLEAAHAVGTYNSEKWIGEVDVPTAVLVTTEDNAIPPIEQMRLLLAIPHSTMHRIVDGHTVCAKRSFAGPLMAACTAVAEGAADRRQAASSPPSSRPDIALAD